SERRRDGASHRRPQGACVRGTRDRLAAAPDDGCDAGRQVLAAVGAGARGREDEAVDRGVLGVGEGEGVARADRAGASLIEALLGFASLTASLRNAAFVGPAAGQAIGAGGEPQAIGLLV